MEMSFEIAALMILYGCNKMGKRNLFIPCFSKKNCTASLNTYVWTAVYLKLAAMAELFDDTINRFYQHTKSVLAFPYVV